MEAVDTRGDAERLLLVEDEFLIRLTLSEALLDAGYEVVEAADADEALSTVAETPIKLLLTDVQLPGPIDGPALAARLRETWPDLPVVFMTGRPDAGALASGARDRFVAKPYLPSEVCAVVNGILRS